MPADDPHVVRLLLTAQEAYPALEDAFLNAQSNVLAGFRIFDPWTTLRSAAARETGTTWFDLLVNTLNRGVRIDLTISDFDPVIRPDNHRYTWQCIGAAIAAGEASDYPENLRVNAAMHPARVGLLPRLLLWPGLMKQMKAHLQDINTQPGSAKRAFARYTPGLQPLLKWRGDDLVPRLSGPPPLVPVSHHQKLAVFDEQTLYIGGLDLNDRRYDTPEHQGAADETWHDAQVLVQGPVAAEAARHVRDFQKITQGAPPSPASHLLRTLSAKRRFSLPWLSPRPVLSELMDAHRQAIASSRSLIYMETQFFRDRRLADHLAAQAQKIPDLTMILILPSAPDDAAFADDPGSDVAYGEYLQAQCTDTLRGAFGARFFAGSPARPVSTGATDRTAHFGAPLIYLHAKVSVFDTSCAIISSANLNGRSLSWDTEAGVAIRRPGDVEHVRTRCFDHWLGPQADRRCYVTETACAEWTRAAGANARVRPEDRKGFMLPYASEPGAEFGYNLPGVPAEMV